MTAPENKSKLRVDIAAIEVAFQDDSFETHYYLDRQSGQIVQVTNAARDSMERVYEELNRAGDSNFHRFADAVRRAAWPEEEKQAALQAHQVESGLATRYIALPPAHPHRALLDMEDFCATVSDPALRDRLPALLHGPDSARRFEEALAENDGERRHWEQFREQHLRQHISFWLEEEGIIT